MAGAVESFLKVYEGGEDHLSSGVSRLDVVFQSQESVCRAPCWAEAILVLGEDLFGVNQVSQTPTKRGFWLYIMYLNSGKWGRSDLAFQKRTLSLGLFILNVNLRRFGDQIRWPRGEVLSLLKRVSVQWE